MHNLKVFISGPISFLNTINELTPFLKFKHFTEKKDIEYDIILFHEESLKNKQHKDFYLTNKSLKILASIKKNSSISYDAHLQLPTTIKEINSIVELISAKKKFNKNSSIKVKSYVLNKNEKKLSDNRNFIILTEKEIQLIELLLNSSKPVSKENILSSVWHYSSDADTHTVETHIYRLRKKINEKFMDENFIFINKDGYYL